MVCFSQCSSDKKQPSLSSFLQQFLAFIFYCLISEYFMKVNLPRPEIIVTSSLWTWVQSLTVNGDPRGSCFSRRVQMPRCSSGDSGVCVVQGEIMVRFGRCCYWVHGVAAPRLNLPEPQRQLLAEGLQAPEGTSKVSESNPTPGTLPYPCQEHGPSLDPRLSHCY